MPSKRAIHSGTDVMITPNPWTRYRRLAYMLNKHRVNCRWLHTFNMDEYANEKGETAPRYRLWEVDGRWRGTDSVICIAGVG